MFLPYNWLIMKKPTAILSRKQEIQKLNAITPSKKYFFMKIKCFIFFVLLIHQYSCGQPNTAKSLLPTGEMMIRIAELEIDTAYLAEYIAILKEEAAKSVQLEEGVLCIFPMYEKDNPVVIRLLEIYSNEAAYQSHLQTPHFKAYKTTTLHMVKSLKLIEMQAIDQETMFEIFCKLEQE